MATSGATPSAHENLQSGSRPVKPRGWRRLLSWKAILATILVFGLVAVAAVVVMYQTTSIPDPNKAATAQKSTVYYADGKTELGSFSSANRTAIPLSQVPKLTREALIASEDRTFYENNGVSVRGTIRAFANNLRGGSQQGGSTLTQQYVKNYYLNSSRSYTRKIREAMLAVKLDRTLSKNTILQNYLNTVYFGRGAYGIEAAAETFWGIPAKKLTVSQSALLVGILPSPTRYDPARSPKDARAKWAKVLSDMVRDGYITPAQRAAQKFPLAPLRKNRNAFKGNNGYLLEAVRDELRKAGMDDSQIEGGGLKIVSTFDADMQRKLVGTMNDGDVFPRDRPKGLLTGVTTVDPTSGAVRAMYGGADYLKRQRNSATQDIGQAGSTFKPFALLTALDKGYSLNSTFNGANNQVFPGYPKGVRNFGGSNYGYMNLIRATANSVNGVYVNLNQDVGPSNTMETAIKAGLPRNTNGLNPYLSNVLGAAAPHNIDMASAYATFAAKGVRHETHFVERVTGPDRASGKQKTFYSGPTDGTRAFDEGKIADLTYAMQQVVRSGSGNRAQALGRPVAGKTGTSNNAVSAWFVGFTPQLVTAVSLFNVDSKGHPQPIPSFGGFGTMTGGALPAKIWTSYMRKAVEGTEAQSFPDPTWGGSFKGTRVPSPAQSSPPSNSSTQQPNNSWTPSQTWTQQSNPATPQPSNPWTQPQQPSNTWTQPQQPSQSQGTTAPPQAPPGNGNGNGNGNGSGNGGNGGGGNGNGGNGNLIAPPQLQPTSEPTRAPVATGSGG